MNLSPNFDETGGPQARPVRANRPLRLALAGYGIVGQALAARLREAPQFEISSILVRHPERERAVAPPRPLTADRNAFLGATADVLIDVLSCEQTGAILCRDVLSRGVHVVSASKRVISASHRELAAARTRDARLLYSAAVGGGAPVLETVAAAREQGEIREVRGILNGTVNYVLSRLAEGFGFEEALAQARHAGFAEEDPHEDLSGADAAAKLRLIALQAFDVDPGQLEVTTEPLDERAVARIRLSGERWVQLSRIVRGPDGLHASVTLRPRGAAAGLPDVRDEYNCAAVTLADGSIRTCLGRGAGGAPTAEAIFGDLRALVSC